MILLMKGLLLGTAHGADAPSSAAISLLAYDEAQALTQASTEPLLLTVSAGNPSAQNAATQNSVAERQISELQKNGALQKLSPEEQKAATAYFKTVPIVSVQVGQAGHSLAEAFHFIITDSHGKTIPVTVRPLAASAEQAGLVSLDATNTLSLFFGVDADALSKLPDDTYTFEARMQVRDAQGKLLPEIPSSPVRVTLKKLWTEPRMEKILLNNYKHGRYYLLDHQFAQIEPYVQKMLVNDPNSISAYELRGDALAGQGKLPEAKDAYLKALNLFDTKYHGQKNVEYPAYLESRLTDVVQKLNASSK